MDGPHLGLQRAAPDQPHHELDSLGSRLAQVFDVRDPRDLAGVVDQPIEPAVVPLFVDESGTRSLELVAHSAGAPDLDIEIRVEGLHGIAEGLAELEAP